MADIDETEGGEEEWVDPGEAPVPPDTGEDAPELPAEEESFETLGGVAQDGGEIIAPDITGGTITGARIVSENSQGTVILSSGSIDSGRKDGFGNDIYQRFGYGEILIEISRTNADTGRFDSGCISLEARDGSQMGGDEFYPEVSVRLESRNLSGMLMLGDNCLEIRCHRSDFFQESFIKMWGDGGVRIGNSHGFLHITPEGQIRVERDGQRVNLI